MPILLLLRNMSIHPDKWFFYDGDQLVVRSGVNDPDFYIRSAIINLHNNIFHHVAVVAREGYAPIFYLDGVNISTSVSIYHKSPESPGSSANSYNLILGAAKIGSDVPDGYFWNGFIDELIIYNRVLSANEIASHYKACKK